MVRLVWVDYFLLCMLIYVDGFEFFFSEFVFVLLCWVFVIFIKGIVLLDFCSSLMYRLVLERF